MSNVNIGSHNAPKQRRKPKTIRTPKTKKFIQRTSARKAASDGLNSKKIKIFICHSRNLNVVERLVRELIASGFEIWVDYLNLRAWPPIPIQINKALEKCDIFLLVWSKFTKDSKQWVPYEWSAAIYGEKPLLICRADDAELPLILASFKYVDLRNFPRGVEELLRELSELRQHLLKFGS